MDVTNLIAQVAIRRDHRTRYTAMKAFIKAHNSRDKETKTRWKTHSVLQAVSEFMKSDDHSLRDRLRIHGVKIDDNSYLHGAIEELEEIKKKAKVFLDP